MTLRLGLVGAGKAGRLHADAIKVVPSVRLVAIADLDASRGQPLAAQFGAAYVRTTQELLEHHVDAVIVALPHAELAPTALEVLKAGKHLLLEKPMGVSLAEADTVIAAAAAAGVVLQIGYVHRYRPELQAARKLVREGALGRLALVVEDHNMSDDRTVGPWVWQPEMNGGGVLFYSGIHGIDRIRWLTGQEIVLAFAQMDRFAHPSGLDDNAAATLRLADGCIVALNQNFTPFPIPNKWETQLYGTDGVIRLAVGRLEFFDRSGGHSVALEPRNHFEQQLLEFVAAIEERRSPAVPGEEGRANLAAMLALYESARTNRPVPVQATGAR